MVEIIVAIIGGIFLVFAQRMNQKMNKVHHQVTVNGGKSKEPTLLDELSDIKSDIRYLDGKFDAHIQWHLDHETDKSKDRSNAD